MLCCQLPMNHLYWDDLVASPAFSNLSELNRTFILENMLAPSPVETMSTSGDFSSEGAVPEVVNVEVPAAVPTAPRSPRPNPTPVKEVPKIKKDKQKKLVPVHESPRKHAATRAQRKENLSTKEKGKAVDLETKEGAKDIDIEGVDHISKLSEYIPPCKGKMKVPKDLDAGQFLLNAPLLPENITFEGLCLAWIPHLKLEDWYLVDHKRFPHMAIDNN